MDCMSALKAIQLIHSLCAEIDSANRKCEENTFQNVSNAAPLTFNIYEVRLQVKTAWALKEPKMESIFKQLE